jgi:hypothetical protein
MLLDPWKRSFRLFTRFACVHVYKARPRARGELPPFPPHTSLLLPLKALYPHSREYDVRRPCGMCQCWRPPSLVFPLLPSFSHIPATFPRVRSPFLKRTNQVQHSTPLWPVLIGQGRQVSGWVICRPDADRSWSSAGPTRIGRKGVQQVIEPPPSEPPARPRPRLASRWPQLGPQALGPVDLSTARPMRTPSSL